MRFNFKMLPSFTLGIIYWSATQPYFVSSRDASPTKRLLNSITFRSGANINALDKMRSTSFRHPFINIIITQALNCARPCFSCTEVAVSVTSRDLLLSSVWKQQIILWPPKISWKEKTVYRQLEAMRLVGYLSFHINSRLWNNYCWNKRTAVCVQDDVFSCVYRPTLGP